MSAVRDEARALLARGVRAANAWHVERLATALGGAPGAARLAVHLATSPLQSASLFAHAIRSRMLRNAEFIGAPAVMRRVLDYAGDAHRIWAHVSSMAHKRAAVQESRDALELRVATLRTQRDLLSRLLPLSDDAHDAELRTVHTRRLEGAISAAQDDLEKTTIVLDAMETQHVRGSLHPSSLLKGDLAFLTPAQSAALPAARGAIRGILVRIKGPKRDTRAETWQKSAGRISTNSVGHVVAEEAKVQIPTKSGIYGLTVRIVWSLAARLVSHAKPMRLVDRVFTPSDPLLRRP